MMEGRSIRTRHSQYGLSMIELMISIVIGLFITFAVLEAFVGSRATYSMQTALSRVQENGRFAVAYLSQDIRPVGYLGCTSKIQVANVVRNSGAIVPELDMAAPLTGVNNIAAGVVISGNTVLAGTDTLSVRFVSTTEDCAISGHSGTTLTCNANHNFAKARVLIVSDCKQATVFQKTNTGVNASIEHATGNAVTPGNCSAGLGTPTNCVTANTYNFAPGAVVRPVESYRYFVANNVYNEPSLFREGLDYSTTNAQNMSAIELVEGVEDIQFVYGVDTSNDGTANVYVPANQVADMGNVIAVRAHILIRSAETNVMQDSQTVQFLGAPRTFNDGRLRRVFTTTIALRNRL